MSQNDTRILHIYDLAEMILFLIIKVAEQVWREPGQGEPGVPGSPLAILRYCAIICNFLMILYLYLWHGCRLHLSGCCPSCAFRWQSMNCINLRFYTSV